LISLPSELKPFLLDLSENDKQAIDKLFINRSNELLCAEWSKIVLDAYEDGSLELSEKLAHMVSRIAYYSMQFSIPFELSIKYSSSGAKLWWIEYLIQKGESEKAKELLDEIEYDKLTLLEKAEWHNMLSTANQRVGNYSEIIELSKGIEQFLASITDQVKKSRLEQTLLKSHFNTGWSLLFLGEIAKAESYAKEGIELAKKYQDNIMRGYHVLLLGRIKQFKGGYEQADLIYEESYQYLLKSGDKRTAMACKGNQATVKTYQGKYFEAIENLVPSLDFWVEFPVKLYFKMDISER